MALKLQLHRRRLRHRLRLLERDHGVVSAPILDRLARGASIVDTLERIAEAAGQNASLAEDAAHAAQDAQRYHQRVEDIHSGSRRPD